jgi:pyruvate dehydrogenase E1 component beta subunit
MPIMTISEALRSTLIQVMQNDDRVTLVGEDLSMGVFGVTSGLDCEFGSDRVINTPISETAFVGMGIGAAMTGLKPIIEVMFCDFMGVCFDQILNQAAKTHFLSGGAVDIPLVIRTTMGAGDGSGAMHSQSMYGLLMQIPGLIIACPSTPADASGLLKTAIQSNTPVILMEHKGLYNVKGEVDQTISAVSFGEGSIVKEGSDVTIVALSKMSHVSCEAAQLLGREGISVEVIDPRTISPLDTGIIADSIRKTGRLIVVDEGTAIAGFADHVISNVVENNFDALKCAPRKIVPPHTPVPYGRSAETVWLPNANNIVGVVRDLMRSSDE